MTFLGGNTKTDILKKLEAKRLQYAAQALEHEQDALLLKQRELNAELYLRYKEQKRLMFWKSILYYVVAIGGAVVFYLILKTFV